jgi:hypothetical protein
MVMEKIMLEAFVNQNYLIIENNVVTNNVVWNGNTSIWTPPAGSIALIQATTPAMVWESDNTIPSSWILVEVIGAGDIGFTWDGSVLTTNQPKPT